MSKDRPLSVEQAAMLRRIAREGVLPWMHHGGLLRTLKSLRLRGLVDSEPEGHWLITARGIRAVAELTAK